MFVARSLSRESQSLPLPRAHSFGEELANTISHCIGLLGAVIATPVLLIAAWHSGSAGFFAGTIVFVATMFVLYFVSMLYHAWPQTRAKKTLQTLDHCAIFLLIAGTYTPFSLGPLSGIWGSAILGTIWLLAIFGVLLKAIHGPLRHRGFGLFLYLAMGWSALIIIRPLISSLPPGALFWLITGGVAYTAGVLFYINERMRYAHFIWHLFVLTGTSCHCLAVFACIA
jgi:hemolysin III